MKKTFLVLFLILLALPQIACRLTNTISWNPVVIMIAAPENPSGTSYVEIEQAYSVIKERLNGMMSGRVKTKLNGKQIDLEFKDKNDIELAKSLVTSPGHLIFWDTKEPLAEGATIPEGVHPLLTESDFADVSVNKNSLGQYGIEFSLNPGATKILADYTHSHIESFLAIGMDGKVITCPRINSEITYGHGMIQSNFTQESANQLAVIIRYKSLPVKMVVKEMQDLTEK